MPPDVVRFFIALGATAVALAVTAVLGRRGRRRPHLAAAGLSSLLLVYTIVLAEMLGRTLIFPRRPLIVHLVFANLGAAGFLAVIITGVRLLRRETPDRRRWHRRAVVTFLIMVALATATGTYLVARSEYRLIRGSLSLRSR